MHPIIRQRRGLSRPLLIWRPSIITRVAQVLFQANAAVKQPHSINGVEVATTDFAISIGREPRSLRVFEQIIACVGLQSSSMSEITRITCTYLNGVTITIIDNS